MLNSMDFKLGTLINLNINMHLYYSTDQSVKVKAIFDLPRVALVFYKHLFSCWTLCIFTHVLRFEK